MHLEDGLQVSTFLRDGLPQLKKTPSVKIMPPSKGSLHLMSSQCRGIEAQAFYFYFVIYFNWRLITLQYCGGFLPYIHMNQPWVYMCFPSWTSLPLPSPSHPSGSSQCISPEHPVSCIEPGLAIHFTYDYVHVSMFFSQIIPPSPSPTESKRLLYTSVTLLLSRIVLLLPSF